MSCKTREKLGFLVCVWLLLCGSSFGKFVVEKNSLKVTSPGSIKGVYECAIGNFGVPQYGGTLIGTVVYPKANQKACKGFDEVDLSFKSKPGGLPTFLLVDRGGAGPSGDVMVQGPYKLKGKVFCGCH